MHLLNMTHNHTPGTVCVSKGERMTPFSGGYWPSDSGQIKDILGSFTKCQFACCESAYMGIPPSFTKFIKVLFIHHLHHPPDYLSTYLYWDSINISTIKDDQHQNHLFILGKLWDLQINLYASHVQDHETPCPLYPDYLIQIMQL